MRVGEARTELEGFQRHRLGSVILPLVVEQIGKVAVDLGIIWLVCQRRVPAFLGLGREAEPLQRISEVVERLGVGGLERERALEAESASLSFSISCRMMPRLFQAAAKSGASSTARRAACSPSAKSPASRHISAKSLKK
jgi:hypothetical protein